MGDAKKAIAEGKTYLGIEFGSTRIKAVLTDTDYNPIASGSHSWENRLDNGIWTYTLDDVWNGLTDCYRNLAMREDLFSSEDLMISSICQTS